MEDNKFQKHIVPELFKGKIPELGDRDFSYEIEINKNGKLEIDYEGIPDNSEIEGITNIKELPKGGYMLQSATFGLIVYMDKKEYTDTLSMEPNRRIHIPLIGLKEYSVWANILSKVIELITGKRPSQIIVGHEHGKENLKCHLQCCVIMDQKIRKAYYPGRINISYIPFKDAPYRHLTLLYMMQNLKTNRNNLIRYCQKDHHYEMLDESKRIEWVHDNSKLKPGEKEEGIQGPVDIYATVVKNLGKLDDTTMRDMFLKYCPKSTIQNYKNIEEFIKRNAIVSGESFQWNFNTEELSKNLATRKVNLLKEWFDKCCVPQFYEDGTQITRRKGLLIYSPVRGVGKTYFTEHLTNDQSKVMIFRQRLCQFKDDDYRLLVLDDIDTKDITENKKTYMQLLTGQKCQIYTKYCNQSWNHNIPCIMTTNDIVQVNILKNSREFHDQVWILAMNDTETLGDPEKIRACMQPAHFALSKEVEDVLEKMQDDFQHGNKDGKALDEFNARYGYGRNRWNEKKYRKFKEAGLNADYYEEENPFKAVVERNLKAEQRHRSRSRSEPKGNKRSKSV